MWKWILTVILAVAATLSSSLIPARVNATFPDVMGCEHSCTVPAGGWPLPYLIDYPGISPVNSVSLVESLLGVDVIWAGALATTFAFWIVLIAASVWTLGRARRLG